MDRPKKISEALSEKNKRRNTLKTIYKFLQKNKVLIYLLSFLLFLSIPIWLSYVAPNILKLPSNYSFTSNVVSVDNFYDFSRKEYTGAQYSQTEYEYHAGYSNSKEIVIQNKFAVRTINDEPIFAVERTYGIDRYTGEHIQQLGDKARTGYLFAPKNLEKGESFTYWHINYDGPATMNYVDEAELYGLKVYHYETRYDGVEIDQTENLSYLPGVGVDKGIILEPYLELWIEPTSGKLVKYQDNTVAYYYDLVTGEKLYPWNNFSNTIREDSVQENVSIARFEKTKINTVNIYAPAILFFLALITLTIDIRVRNKFSKFTSKSRFSLFTSLVVVGAASTVLLGWGIKSEDLIRFGLFEGSIMNPLTATCFLILSIGLISKAFNKSKYIYVIGMLLVGVTSLRILNIFDILSFRIDEVIFRDFVLELSSQMSMFTSLSFFLLGIALITPSIKFLQKLNLVSIMSITTLLLACIALLGYVVELLQFNSLPFFVFTSSTTAILMIISSLTILVEFRYKSLQSLSISIFSGSVIFSVLFLSILLTILFAGTIENATNSEAKSTFSRRTERTSNSLKERLSVYVNVLEGARGLLSASDEVDRDEWKAYIDSLDLEGNYPGVQGIGYAIFIKPEDLDAHVEKIRAEGFPNYTVRPAGERDIYTAIVYLEPFDIRNQQAFGFDMFQEPTRRSAMEQARDSGEARMSGKITLVQEIDEDVQAGFLIYVPFYENGEGHQTSEEKNSSIIGYSYSAYRARDFVESVIASEELEDISLTINDGVGTKEDTLMFDDSENKLGSNNSPKFIETKTFYVAGRPWTLTFESTEDFGETQYSKIAPLIVIAIGISISILITLIVYTIISSRQKAINFANEVTKDLKEAKAKDEAILSSIGDGIAATDELGKIILVNRAFYQILGISEKQVIGKLYNDVVEAVDESDRIVNQEDRIITRALKLNVNKIITNSKMKYKVGTNKYIPVAVTASPILLQGMIEGAVLVFRDVSKEKEIDKAKTEFVSLASHQLRTPLTAISWYTELLGGDEKNKLPKEMQEYNDQISQATAQMSELVDALLNVSRIELGTFAVNPVPTDMNLLMKDVLNELKLLISDKSLKINFETSKVPMVEIDPKLFRIVYQNLLTNAVKYTPKDGAITISIELDGKSLLTKVSDTGYGIPKNQQKEIFSKLFRADNVKTKDTRGTGLGLYIVKSIVEQSKGKIWFESEENKGTTFFVEAPLSGMEKKEGSKFLE